MATTYALTGDLANLIGASFDSIVRVTVKTNVQSGVIVDAAGNKIRLGGASIKLTNTTAFSMDLLETDGATNPTAFQYEVVVEYVDASTRKRTTWSSGPFSHTAEQDLADIIESQWVPPTYLTTVTTQLDTYTENAAASATSAAASASSAASSADLAADIAKPIDTASATALAPGAAPTVTLSGDNPTRNLALGIPAGVADDASMAAQVGAGGAFDSALSASIEDIAVTSATAAAFSKVSKKIERGVEDATVTIISDSTGNETGEWVYLWLTAYAALFPTHTFVYRLWDATGDASYAAPVTVQTGTGSRTVSVYNFAVSGSPTQYVLGSRWQAGYVDTNPDLTIISHGHNEGSSAAGYDARTWRPKYLALTESCTAAHPATGLVCILQNPQIANNDQALRASAYEQAAALRGYGIVDVHQAFLDTGDPAAYTKGDGVHPTTAADAPSPNGSQLWADTVLAASQATSKGQPPTQTPSALLQGAPQILDNGDFADFTSTVPAGWTLTGATATKDTRAGYTKSPNGYGVRLQATGAAQSSLSRFIPEYAAYKGEWVTLLVRSRVDTGQSGNAGRFSVADGTQTMTTIAQNAARDGLFWQAITMKVSESASYLRVLLYGSTGAEAAADVTFDAAYLVRGLLPRLGQVGKRGLTGATGASSSGQIDFLSTFGSHPAMAGQGNSALAVNAANQGIAVMLKPHRDTTVASLDWMVGSAGGNYDIGLYDNAGTRLWSKGSTAWPAGGTTQTETVSPAVVLTAGTTYWLLFSSDGTTGTFRGIQPNQASIRLLDGSYYARTISAIFPLPASMTIGATYSQKIPLVVVRES